MMRDLPTPAQLKSNAASWDPNLRVVYAKRFKPFVQGESGYTIHRTRAVRLDIHGDGTTSVVAYFGCTIADDATFHPVFHDASDVFGTKLCKFCFRDTQ